MSNAPSVPMAQRPATGARALLFGLLMGGLASIALVVAGVLRAGGDVRVPVASITALLLLACKPVADRVAAFAGAPRAHVVSALGMVAIAPLLFCGALIAMGDPILSSHWRCGTGDIGLAMLAPIASFLFGATGALFACVLAANERRRVDALIRGGRLFALGLSIVLLAGAAIRAARKPDPDHYLASLPQVGIIPPVSGEPIQILPAPANPSLGGETRVYEDRMGDLVIHRECSLGSCELSLRSTDDVLPPDLRKWRGVGVDDHSPLPLTRDEKHDLWVVGERLAFQGRDFRVVDIQVGTVADALSPPLGWMLGALAGLLLAAGAGVRRRRLSRRLAALAAAAVGVHNRNGWITMDDSLPAFRAAPDLALPEGPVLIVPGQGGGAAGGAYRGDGALRDAEILSGDRGEHLAAIRGRITALDAFALSALLLTAAPLAAAWVRGLLL